MTRHPARTTLVALFGIGVVGGLAVLFGAFRHDDRAEGVDQPLTPAEMARADALAAAAGIALLCALLVLAGQALFFARPAALTQQQAEAIRQGEKLARAVENRAARRASAPTSPGGTVISTDPSPEISRLNRLPAGRVS